MQAKHNIQNSRQGEIAMSCTRTKTKKISVREFKKEKEHPYKYFKIRYHEMNSVIWLEKVFQKKYDIRRYLDNPLTSDVELEVMELVDDG